MHSYLKSVGFSKVKKREKIREILLDVVQNYDEKTAVEDYPDGIFVEFSKSYGSNCGITVCGQYDEEESVSYRVFISRFFAAQESQRRNRLLWKDMLTRRLLQEPAMIFELVLH